MAASTRGGIHRLHDKKTTLSPHERIILPHTLFGTPPVTGCTAGPFPLGSGRCNADIPGMYARACFARRLRELGPSRMSDVLWFRATVPTSSPSNGWSECVVHSYMGAMFVPSVIVAKGKMHVLDSKGSGFSHRHIGADAEEEAKAVVVFT